MANPESFEERKGKVKERVGKVKNKIMVISGKGGVGKSTVAVNLAFALQMQGFNVGIIDADIHGPNVPKMLGLDEEKLDVTEKGITPAKVQVGAGRALEVMSLAFLVEKDSPVIWRGPLKMAAIQQFLADVAWGDLDYIIFDLPPGTGDEPLSIAQLIDDVTGSVVVTTPQDVALMDSRRSVLFSQKLEIPVLGIVENMAGFKCPHCKKEIDLFKIGGGEKAASDLKVPFLGRIPLDARIVGNGDAGKPFVLAHPESDAGKSFRKIVEKIIKKKE